MKTIINIILIIFAIVVQISLMPKLAIYGGYPNLVLVVMLSLAFIGKIEESLLWLGLGGIILELVSPEKFGFYIFPLMLVFFLTYTINKKIISDPIVTITIGMFLFSSIIMDSTWILTNSFFVSDPTQWIIVTSNAIYNTFVGCIIYILIRYYLKPRENIKI